MSISFDYGQDEIIINDQRFPLDALRRYLLLHHEKLVQAYFIKAIRTNGQVWFSYDWMAIFNIISESMLILEQFRNDN